MTWLSCCSDIVVSPCVWVGKGARGIYRALGSSARFAVGVRGPMPGVGPAITRHLPGRGAVPERRRAKSADVAERQPPDIDFDVQVHQEDVRNIHSASVRNSPPPQQHTRGQAVPHAASADLPPDKTQKMSHHVITHAAPATQELRSQGSALLHGPASPLCSTRQGSGALVPPYAPPAKSRTGCGTY